VPKRALLIVNRKSRSGAASIDAGIQQLKRHGIEIIEGKPRRANEIPELIRRHRDVVDCVIIGGGDGSMNAAASALVDTNLPLGLLPMGTANDLARTLKIPTDVEQAGQIIAAGLLHKIDLGSINGRYFFNVANIGLGVHVRHYLSHELKQRWGIFSYARSLLKAITTLRPFHADIVCDRRHRRVRSIQIAVGNGRYYGGGMTVGEQASIDDCRFFLYSLEPAPWWSMLRFALAFRAGRFERRHPVHIDQGRDIEITTRKPMAITADGEPIGYTPAKFEMLEKAVSVFVPTAYFEDQQEPIHAVEKQKANGPQSGRNPVRQSG
jgi:diacylglycerol kinase (ATP)